MNDKTSRNKKNARRQIIVVFISIMGVMMLGMVLRGTSNDEWAVFEFGQTFGGIFFEVEVEPERIHAVLVNESDMEIMFGQAFALVKLADGAWRVVPFAEDIAFTDEGLLLPPGHHAANAFALHDSMFAYELTPGMYRIVTYVWDNGRAAQAWGAFEM
ncbi:MAG: hypothetical protein FWC70_09025 [Defluviitaleaceae bacterium]|nr:hypothetical protein [Defluviitaleaceae bacterium]